MAKPKPMSGEQYKQALATLGLNQATAGVFLQIGERTSRRYAASKTVPHVVNLLLNLMIEKSVSPKDLGHKE